MKTEDSLTNFFYNIIPGFIFILTLFFLFPHFRFIFFILRNAEFLVTTVLLITSLFLGFLFQSITKIIRDELWNNYIFERIKNKEDPYSYEKAEELLISTSKNKIINLSEENKLKRNFYLMHAFLTTASSSPLSSHFTARFAFWSNMFVGATILTILLFFDRGVCISTMLLFVSMLFFLYVANKNFLNLYDSILKSFVALNTIKLK